MTQASAAPKRRFSKHDFYRYCRIVHGWLSAFAFLILCFFSLTGLFLNHPDWLFGPAPPVVKTQFTLSTEEIERIQDAEEPATALTDIAAGKVDLRGELTGGNQVRHEVFARLQGVRGLSDLRANLNTGTVEAIVEPVRPVTVLNELHRAERAGSTWRLVVDIIAILLIVLSVVGYLIFLSMRTRLRTALLLTAGGTLGLWGLFALVVR